MNKIYIFLVLIISAVSVNAQYKGGNTLGDYGINGGSQPAPGLYASGFYYNYQTDKVLNSEGEQVIALPSDPGEIGINAFAGILWWVTDFKILGGNYGVMGTFAFSNAALNIPVFGLNETTNLAFSDMYIQPINLGWTSKKLDYTAGLGLTMPTGRYEDGADDNVGYGMWSFEGFGGATFYFDEKKSWSFAAIAFYEMHSKKKDSDIKVGDILSLEGAFGKSFMEGAMNFGVAYYAQWKITKDNLNGYTFPLTPLHKVDKHKVYAIGPEATVPIIINKKLIALINARYLWEFGARSMSQGNTLSITATFPLSFGQ